MLQTKDCLSQSYLLNFFLIQPVTSWLKLKLWRFWRFDDLVMKKVGASIGIDPILGTRLCSTRSGTRSTKLHKRSRTAAPKSHRSRLAWSLPARSWSSNGWRSFGVRIASAAISRDGWPSNWLHRKCQSRAVSQWSCRSSHGEKRHFSKMSWCSRLLDGWSPYGCMGYKIRWY